MVIKSKVRLIIRELGRINRRLNSNNSTKEDEELLDEIAEVIAKKHSKSNFKK